GVPTGVEGQPQADLKPEAFVLGNSYPNPAKGQITFSYQLPKAGRASLEIYNMLGQTVQRFDLGYRPAGTHSLSWNSSQAVQGVYFYRLQAGDYSSTKKLVVVK
ncbi:MAG: T9SS type A sorting domain-containing protein, partial [bacterium]|nr:T9SS type A sorting domain-containing protein [bacterium]